MLKKISVQDVRLGMFIQRLEGRWIDHPFWKTRFVIKDQRDLDILRSSRVTEVWVDAEAVDDALPSPPAGPTAEPDKAEPAPSAAPALEIPEALVTMEAELAKAAGICQRGKQILMRLVASSRLGEPVDLDALAPLADDVASSVTRHPGALVSVSRLKSRDEYLYLHSLAVSSLMAALARQLDMDESMCRVASLAGLLHNAGMSKVPQELLNKQGKLTDAEFFVIRGHPVQGHEMLSQLPDLPQQVLDAALHHHEKWDGSGYPFGLQGQSIPLFARMCAICDAYDAVTSNRTYRSGWDPAESIAQMSSWAGSFDPDLFRSFVKSLGVYPTGSLVRLHSQKLAIVVEQHADALLQPSVKVFYSLKSQMPITPERIDLAAPSCRDRIVAREPAANWAKLGLDSLWAGSAMPRRR